MAEKRWRDNKKVWPPDNVTIELATIIDEHSAVDYYRMKKELPIEKATGKPLSFKNLLKESKLSEASPSSSKQKVSDSIDMDYLDRISGKGFSWSKKEDKRIPITWDEFEKLFWEPELTEKERQVFNEKKEKKEREEEEERQKLLDLDAELGATGCCPCNVFKSSPKTPSPKNEKENLDKVLFNFEDGKQSNIVKIESSSSDQSSIHSLEIKNVSHDSKQGETTQHKPSDKAGTGEISKENTEKPKEKKKKSVWQKMTASFKKKEKKVDSQKEKK